MSTFLQICQDVVEECGISGAGAGNAPSSVLNQTGEYRRVVNWVKRSWNEVQRKKDNWKWMNQKFTFDTVSDQRAYTLTDVFGGSFRFRRWMFDTFRVYLKSAGSADEQILTWEPYPLFLLHWQVGTQVSGRPDYVAEEPETHSLLLGPKPNDIWTVSGNARKSIQILAADTDVPECPEEFHDIIMYRAMMKYARYEAATEIYTDARNEYRTMMSEMARTETPDAYLPEPLV